jgi:hypothetical protein
MGTAANARRGMVSVGMPEMLIVVGPRVVAPENDLVRTAEGVAAPPYSSGGIPKCVPWHDDAPAAVSHHRVR